MTVLQTNLPAYPWMDPRLSRLPGILPLDPDDWLVVDEAYAGQMAVRDRLLAERPADVRALTEPARPAAGELYRLVLARLPGLGFRVSDGQAERPDGVTVPLDPGRPLLTLGRLVQEDLCLMQPGGEGEHVLTGAVLCFPASWTLAEKIGRPLLRIHAPVPGYAEGVGPRVQRLCDAIRPERPLWRMNFHRYLSAELFQPRREGDPRPKPAGPAPYLRSERQCLLKLPETGAVVFSIHTYVVGVETLPEAARAGLEAWDFA
ncbi:MAG: hypothetical protein B7Z02_06445 [Rhodobacterales bacterium 32-67-9]|nr:MAG: hypothetical protein B7Z02_06445 [Rhodobacterales bacterium 32-67-9]